MAKAMRLDKFLADAGMGTRAEVKRQIQKGQVFVNGCVIKRPETKILPEDMVELNGQRIGAAPEFIYILLHKPSGCVSATEDPRETTVMDCLPEEMKNSRRGLFPVGRLDKDTEGLLLITDDGALAHELLSPKKHVDKTYYAVVEGEVTKEDIKKTAEGLDIGEERNTLPARLEILKINRETEPPRSEIHLTICEGKFHQVKRMMHALGKEVVYLKRISMGNLQLPDDLKKGECRLLSRNEISLLKKG